MVLNVDAVGVQREKWDVPNTFVFSFCISFFIFSFLFFFVATELTWCVPNAWEKVFHTQHRKKKECERRRKTCNAATCACKQQTQRISCTLLFFVGVLFAWEIERNSASAQNMHIIKETASQTNNRNGKIYRCENRVVLLAFICVLTYLLASAYVPYFGQVSTFFIAYCALFSITHTVSVFHLFFFFLFHSFYIWANHFFSFHF